MAGLSATSSISSSISDPEPTITSNTGCNTVTVSNDTLGATFTCTATSSGGTSNETVTIKRDATAPALSPTVAAVPLLLNAAIAAQASASDATSGIATQTCAALVTDSVGTRSASSARPMRPATAPRRAANYRVVYGFAGFEGPLLNGGQ